MNKFLSALALTVLLVTGCSSPVTPDMTDTPIDGDAAETPSDLTTIEGADVNYSLSYDPAEWTFTKSTDGSASEYDFENSNGSVFGQVIAEELELDMDTLEETVLANAQAADPKAEITSSTDKMVNGKNVRVLEMKATIEGLNFVYYGYYYTGAEGTLQVMTWTTSNLSDKYRADADVVLGTLKIGE